MEKIKIGIIGGAGYTGGELIRLLIHHPNADLSLIHSRSNAGKPVAAVHPDLLGDTSLSFTNDITLLENGALDVVFLCLGHGESTKFLTENKIAENVKVIDLANDFRMEENARFAGREFVYGLPELNRTAILSAQNIANPGCFATTIQLGLLPLAKAGLLEEVFTTGITGSTGAGQGLSATSHFSWRASNIQAYKTLTHQHLAEIVQSLNKLLPEGNNRKNELNFVPWRGDFTRGIFISSTVHCHAGYRELLEVYKEFYKDAAFTFVSEQQIFLKQVVNTNKCMIQLEKVGSKLVVHSIADNLLKGASGQAVQNMNLMFGLDETAGLHLKAGYF